MQLYSDPLLIPEPVIQLLSPSTLSAIHPARGFSTLLIFGRTTFLLC
jgi:hypothetical protein